MGRPSEYTPEIGEEICALLAENGSIRLTAATVGVDRSTIRHWTEAYPDFATAIARAKQDGYDSRAEQAVAKAKIATDAPLGRLAFDADRWYLSKIDPARYGDKLDLTSSDKSMSPGVAHFWGETEPIEPDE